MSEIKSKKRVRDHGEVFTPEFIVSDMFDLVNQETERIDSRFLEPACGTGNFLVPVLKRKLDVVKKKYKRSQLEYEKHSIVAIGSIYGIDLLEDNVKEARKRLFEIFDKEYTKLYKKKTFDECRESVKFILSRNVLQGDALNLKTDNGELIVFAEWSNPVGLKIKRRDFVFSDLVDPGSDLFSMGLISDTGKTVFSPQNVFECMYDNFLKLK